MSIAPSSTLSKVQWMVAGLYAAAIILMTSVQRFLYPQPLQNLCT